jgi:PIN domain nuclease of toxin-antitoxin system
VECRARLGNSIADRVRFDRDNSLQQSQPHGQLFAERPARATTPTRVCSVVWRPVPAKMPCRQGGLEREDGGVAIGQLDRYARMTMVRDHGHKVDLADSRWPVQSAVPGDPGRRSATAPRSRDYEAWQAGSSGGPGGRPRWRRLVAGERALRRRPAFAAERALGRIVIVLDTHAWIWWLDGSKKLPARTRRRLDRARAIGVCAISCWEVARLVVHGRLKLDRQVQDWVASALRAPRVELLALEPEIAVAAATLGAFGGDPADHMIVATARDRKAPLATADERITESGLVDIVW